MHKRLQALGRLKTGQMNNTEEAYSKHLESLKAEGIIAWFKFEGMKFRLAGNTFYTPDFAVMRSDGVLQMHEVKGYWQDDARVKIKIAAELYPMDFIAIRKGKGGKWEMEEF